MMMTIRILITAIIIFVQENYNYNNNYYYYFYIDPLNRYSIVYDKGAKTKKLSTFA